MLNAGPGAVGPAIAGDPAGNYIPPRIRVGGIAEEVLMQPNGDGSVSSELPFLEVQQLTEEERTEAVKALLAQGFSVADIWTIAPSLLSVFPASAQTISIPLRVF